MGMYADVRGTQLKFSWPLSEAISNALPEGQLQEMLDDNFVKLTRSDVQAVLTAGYYMLTSGVKDRWNGEDTEVISAQYFVKVETLAKCMNVLADWFVWSEDQEIIFG